MEHNSGPEEKNTRMIIIALPPQPPSPFPLCWTRKLNMTYWRAQGRLLVTPEPRQGASVLLKACLLMSGGSRGTVRLSSKWSCKHFNLKDTWKVMTNLLQTKTADSRPCWIRGLKFPTLSFLLLCTLAHMHVFESSKLNSGGKVFSLLLLVNEESVRHRQVDVNTAPWINPSSGRCKHTDFLQAGVTGGARGTVFLASCWAGGERLTSNISSLLSWACWHWPLLELQIITDGSRPVLVSHRAVDIKEKRQ